MTSPEPPLRPAVFFDRDGTLNEPPPPGGYVLRVEDLRLVPDAANATRRLKEDGWFLALATNQRCVALGLLSLDRLAEIHERMQSLLRMSGGEPLDAIYQCVEDRGSPRRKPSPEMLLQAASEHGLDLARSWMVGDSMKDVGAALAAGVRPILVEHPGTGEERGECHPDVESRLVRVRSLAQAATHILAAPIGE